MNSSNTTSVGQTNFQPGGSVDIFVVTEPQRGLFKLQKVHFQRYHSGSDIIQRLKDLDSRPRNLLSLRTWTSRPVIQIVKVLRIATTNPDLEIADRSIPVRIVSSRCSVYLTHGFSNPSDFPSALRLQRYLKDELRSPNTRTLPVAYKAVLLRYETSKMAVLVFVSAFLTLSVVLGVIIGKCTGRSDVGISATGAFVGMATVIQGFLYKEK